MRLYSAIVSVAIMGGSVQAWSGAGHEAVARVAHSVLKDKTKRYLAETLGSELGDLEKKLEDVSTWADDFKKLPGNGWTSVWHFASIPRRNHGVCLPFDYAENCGGRNGCVVSAINRFTLIASDPARTKADRADAIKFLVHFVGDLHCPVHMGFELDEGGTKLDVKLGLADRTFDRTLHEVWDSDLLTFARTNSADKKTLVPVQNYIRLVSELGKAIDERTVFDHPALENWTASMASDVIMGYTCDSAYTHTNGHFITNNDALTADYITRRSADAVTLLQMAGVRLGQLLNAVAEAHTVSAAPAPVATALRVSPKKQETPKKQSVFAGLDDEDSDSDHDEETENERVSNTEVRSVVIEAAPAVKKSKSVASDASPAMKPKTVHAPKGKLTKGKH